MSLLESVLRHAPIVRCIDAHLTPVAAHALRYAVPPRCFAACARRPVVDVARFVRRGLWYMYGSAAQDLWPLVEDGTCSLIGGFVAWCLKGHPDEFKRYDVVFCILKPISIGSLLRTQNLLSPNKYLLDCPHDHFLRNVCCLRGYIRGICIHFVHGYNYTPVRCFEREVVFSIDEPLRMPRVEYSDLLHTPHKKFKK